MHRDAAEGSRSSRARISPVWSPARISMPSRPQLVAMSNAHLDPPAPARRRSRGSHRRSCGEELPRAVVVKLERGATASCSIEDAHASDGRRARPREISRPDHVRQEDRREDAVRLPSRVRGARPSTNSSISPERAALRVTEKGASGQAPGVLHLDVAWPRGCATAAIPPVARRDSVWLLPARIHQDQRRRPDARQHGAERRFRQASVASRRPVPAPAPTRW